MKKIESMRSHIIFAVVCFVFFMFFFTSICPIVLFDTDDYFNTNHMRPAIPIWGLWNPAKVFPEVLMPLLGLISGKIITPIVKDYFNASSLVMGCAVAISITGYLLCFKQYMEKKLSLVFSQSVVVTVFFAIFHFWAMRTSSTNNPYLFRAINATCYFNYTVPTLLNCSLVLLLEGGADALLFEKGHYIKKGLFLIGVYMAIFSNLYSSHVLTIYCGVRFLRAYLSNIRKQTSRTQLMDECKLNIPILIAWGISAIYEQSGGRAGSIISGNLINSLYASINCFINLPHKLNFAFLKFSILVILLTLFLAFVFKKLNSENIKQFVQNILFLLVCIFLVSCYLIIISAVTSSGYLYYECVLLSLAFYIFLYLSIHIGVLLRCFPSIITLAPISIVILYCAINTDGITFKPSNVPEISAETCQYINRVLLQQIRSAEEKNMDSVYLYIPDWGNDTNWPHSGPQRIADNLFNNGIIPYPIEINAVIDSSFEERYNIRIR